MIVGKLLLSVYDLAIRLAMKNNQVVGKDKNRYVTIQQLEAIIRKVALENRVTK